MTRFSLQVCEPAQWLVNTESKPVDFFLCGRYWRKLPGLGCFYALTCVGQKILLWFCHTPVKNIMDVSECPTNQFGYASTSREVQ